MLTFSCKKTTVTTIQTEENKYIGTYEGSTHEINRYFSDWGADDYSDTTYNETKAVTLDNGQVYITGISKGFPVSAIEYGKQIDVYLGTVQDNPMKITFTKDSLHLEQYTYEHFGSGYYSDDFSFAGSKVD